jgi:hypothetical protein
LVHIKTQTVTSAVASVEFIHGTSGVTFDGTYKRYKVIYGNLNVADTGVRVGVQFRTGSSFDTGNNYSWAGIGRDDPGNTQVGNSTGDSLISLSPRNTAKTSTQDNVGEFIMSDPSATNRYKALSGYTGGMGGNAYSESYICGGSWEDSSAINGFRFIATSGNIDTVTVSLFGVAES